MSKVLSIDPGMSTGLVRAKVTDDAKPHIEWKLQVENGLEGLQDMELPFYLTDPLLDRVVCEAFHPRPMSRSYRLDELEPLRIEGYVWGHRGDTLFRQPEQRHLFKEGDNFAKSKAFLQWAGYWTTGSEVGCDDANDTNSAMMHLFGYLRDNKHRPTISLLLDYNRSIATKEGTE